jgi:hypothetical protein
LTSAAACLPALPATALDAVPPFAASIIDPLAGVQTCSITGAVRAVACRVAVVCEGALQKAGKVNPTALKWREFRLTPAGLFQLRGTTASRARNCDAIARRLAAVGAPPDQIAAACAAFGVASAKVDFGAVQASAEVSSKASLAGRGIVVTQHTGTRGHWSTREFVAASAADARMWVAAVNAVAERKLTAFMGVGAVSPLPLQHALARSAAALHVAARRTLVAGLADAAQLNREMAAASLRVCPPAAEDAVLPLGPRLPAEQLAAALRVGWLPGRGDGPAAATAAVPLAESDGGEFSVLSHVLAPVVPGGAQLRLVRLQNATWAQSFADSVVGARWRHGAGAVVGCASAYVAPLHAEDVHAIAALGPFVRSSMRSIAAGAAATAREAAAAYQQRGAQRLGQLGVVSAGGSARPSPRCMVVLRVAFVMATGPGEAARMRAASGAQGDGTAVSFGAELAALRAALTVAAADAAKHHGDAADELRACPSRPFFHLPAFGSAAAAGSASAAPAPAAVSQLQWEASLSTCKVPPYLVAVYPSHVAYW